MSNTTMDVPDLPKLDLYSEMQTLALTLIELVISFALIFYLFANLLYIRCKIANQAPDYRPFLIHLAFYSTLHAVLILGGFGMNLYYGGDTRLYTIIIYSFIIVAGPNLVILAGSWLYWLWKGDAQGNTREPPPPYSRCPFGPQNLEAGIRGGERVAVQQTSAAPVPTLAAVGATGTF